MARFCSYSFKTPPKIVSAQDARDFAYGISFTLESDVGEFSVDMDKEGRIMMYGAVQLNCPKGFVKVDGYDMMWCFDPAIVATFAKMIEENWNQEPGARWPDKGEEVPILSESEVRATMLKYGIPTMPAAAEEIRAESEPLNDNGEPPWL